MTKNKNVYFALNYNGIILVEVPRRLGISPKTDDRTIQTILAAQEFLTIMVTGTMLWCMLLANILIWNTN